jgi:cytochrome c peroxidase
MRVWGVCALSLLAACDAAKPSTLDVDAQSEGRALVAESASANNEPVTWLRPSPYSKTDPKVQLGRHLFFSHLGNGDQKNPGVNRCVDCHPIGGDGSGASGSDYRVKMGNGDGAPLKRINCPTIFNAVTNFRHTWDGKDETLEEVVLRPIKAKSLMGGEGGPANIQATLERIKKDTTLVDGFTAAGLKVDKNGLAVALSAFLIAVAPRNAPFDRYLRNEIRGDALDAEVRPMLDHVEGFKDLRVKDASAEQGYRTFKKLGCVSCHQGEGVGGSMFARFGDVVLRGDCTECRRWHTTKKDWVKRTECTGANGADECTDWSDDFANLGRQSQTEDSDDKYIFKVPSLRNVARTRPYFHDNSAPTLPEAIRAMAMLQLDRELSDVDVANLTAFLTSLNGVEDPNLVTDPVATKGGEQ